MQYFLGDAEQKMLQDASNGIVRKELRISRTRWVLPDEETIVSQWIQKLLDENGIRIPIKTFGNYQTSAPTHSSPDWYQSMALESGPLSSQVRAKVLNELMRSDPHQSVPHFDFLLVDRDMRYDRNDGLNFIFGYGPYPNNLLSVTRLRAIADENVRLLALATLAAHEFWHNLWLANRSQNIGSEGLHKGHCMGQKWACLMQQVFSVADIEQRAITLAKRWCFLCEDCAGELRMKLKHLKENGVFL